METVHVGHGFLEGTRPEGPGGQVKHKLQGLDNDYDYRGVVQS